MHGAAGRTSPPREALHAGIGMVHQHFRLVEPTDRRRERRPRRPPRRRPPFRVRHAAASAGRRPRERYGLAVDPTAIWQLSVGEQQRVEILKALYREARVLILDEPTAVLTPQEADQILFATLRAMAAATGGRLHLAQAARGAAVADGDVLLEAAVGRSRPSTRAP